MPDPTHMNHPQQSEELKALLAAQRPTPRWLSRLRMGVRGLLAVTLLAFCPIAEAATLDLDRLMNQARIVHGIISEIKKNG